jgi:hypothetical protein
MQGSRAAMPSVVFGRSDVMEQRCVLFSLNMWVKGASEKFKEVFNSFDGSVVSG